QRNLHNIYSKFTIETAVNLDKAKWTPDKGTSGYHRHVFIDVLNRSAETYEERFSARLLKHVHCWQRGPENSTANSSPLFHDYTQRREV
ncbi:hypothetical protein XENOCAPTIV_028361, partial [Xenoophorus captivus]